MTKKISVVVTTYNEKENIGSLLPQILEKDSRLNIIVVDDSSPDGTGDIVKGLAAKYKGKIKLISRKERGVGTALQAGFKEALKIKADIIIQMDADFSHNPFYITEFIKQIESGSDVVVGSRYAMGGGIASRSVIRNVISQIANLYNHIFLGMWQVSDTASGYKAYKPEVLANSIKKPLISSGYSIGVENLYRISKLGYKIKEIPIQFSDRNAGNSKMSFYQLVLYMLSVIRVRFSNVS